MTKKNKQKIQLDTMLENIIDISDKIHYCINCEWSYLHLETGNGYCKYQREDAPYRGGFLKPITEFGICDHWEKKEK